jgi:hypothetical protein
MSSANRELTSMILNMLADVKSSIDVYEKRLEKVHQDAGGRITAEGPGRKRRKKMSKAERTDPNRVKRPHSTYIRFVMETRPLVEQENPNISQAELMKELGKRWKSLSPQDREQYKRQYEQAKRESGTILGSQQQQQQMHQQQLQQQQMAHYHQQQQLAQVQQQQHGMADPPAPPSDNVFV